MTQDIVVTIVRRDTTGREDMIRLRAREARPAQGAQADAPPETAQVMPHETKKRIMDFLTSRDSDGAVRSKLRDTSNPLVFQTGGNLILRPLQIKARKIPTSCAVTSLPDGLGDLVPPLRFTHDCDLSLDTVSEALVSFGMRRSEAQFLSLYVSDIVDDAETTGKPRAVSVSLDTMNVLARVERTTADDKTNPNQLRILVVCGSHTAAVQKPNSLAAQPLV